MLSLSDIGFSNRNYHQRDRDTRRIVEQAVEIKNLPFIFFSEDRIHESNKSINLELKNTRYK